MELVAKNESRKCRLCECDLVVDDNWSRYLSKSRSYICKPCNRVYHAKWREANKEELDRYRKDWSLKKTYGLTIEQYNDMFENQEGCCDICGKHQSEESRALSVDHCHDTGAIRGLLCNNCNSGIGKFSDNIEVLEKALNYLRRSYE